MVFDKLWFFYVSIFGSTYTGLVLFFIGLISFIIGLGGTLESTFYNKKAVALLFSSPLLTVFSPILLPIVSFIFSIYLLFSLL